VSRLEGAAVWAAYGTVEVALTIFVRRVLFTSTFVPPDDRFTFALLLLYPLIGALLGRFAVAGLVVAFVANAIVTVTGAALAVPLAGAAVAVALFRRRAWPVALLLLLPIWAAREIGYVHTFVVKALFAGAAIAAVVLLGWLTRKHALKSIATLAVFVLAMIAAMFVDVRPPRDVVPDQPPPRTPSPSIVLVVMDTVRADHLSLYGYGRRTTPHLEQLARTATVYTRAYAPSNMTLPTHASLFTGLYGTEHTAHNDEGWAVGRPLPARVLTIAELLAARGYATASIAANYVYLGDEFGLDQGFHHVDARPPRLPFGGAWNFYLRSRIAEVASRVIELSPRTRLLSRPAEEISDLAIRYLARVAGKRRPFFLVLNYMDAHAPCIPPAPYDAMFPGRDPAQPVDLADRLMVDIRTRGVHLTPRQRAHLVSQYDGGIAHADHQIARVFASLRERGVFDDTLVIVLSDHGESFGEHGIFLHGYSNYDVETRVPLVVKKPRQTTASVVAEPVSLLDVWPLLSSSSGSSEFLGVPRSAGATPRNSLRGTPRNSEELRGTRSAAFPVITEAFPMNRAAAEASLRRAGTAKIDGTLKTIVNIDGRVETYDLAADPGEARNLAPNEVSRRMSDEIGAWRKSLATRKTQPAAQPIDPETIRRLRALGYIQ
jgi:arylsulfatase A-like enzyme